MRAFLPLNISAVSSVGRYHTKCPQLSTQGRERGQNWVKSGPHSCWMTLDAAAGKSEAAAF